MTNPSPSLLSPRPVAARHGTSAGAVLFAVTAKEEAIFFGRGGGPPSLPGEARHHRSRSEGWAEVLEEFQPEVLVSCWSTPALPSAWLEDPRCPLRYVCHLTGAVRGVVPRSFIERGGRVTNWGGLAAPQVAEHALLLALAAFRGMPEWRAGNWDCKLMTETLYDQRVGLHGFGQVARAARELLRPFRAKMRAFSPGVPPSYMRAHGTEPCGSLKELFANSDVVIECEALTPESRGSVTAEVLGALRNGGVFVNVGRGLVVDEEALIAEAGSGRLRIALDVVSEEPLAPDSPLATLPKVIYSPHLAGPTGDRFTLCGKHALENLARHARNLPLESEVTLEIYDRAT